MKHGKLPTQDITTSLISYDLKLEIVITINYCLIETKMANFFYINATRLIITSMKNSLFGELYISQLSTNFLSIYHVI